jgi:hypothetical protein
MNNMGLKCPLTLLIGVKALIIALKQWNQDKDVSIQIIKLLEALLRLLTF